MTVLPAAFHFAMICASTPIDDMSRFDAGSSSTSTSGSLADTEAQAMRCFSPPDSLNRLRSRRPSSPKSALTRATASSIRDTSQPWFSQPKRSSDTASTLKNWLRGFWNTEPTMRAVSATGSTDTSAPQTLT